MSPPTPKEWWLAAALTGAAVPSALAQATPPDAERRPAGQVTSTTPAGTLASAPLYIDNANSRRVVNDTNQPMHVLFSDQSAITVAPKSEVTIREYKFDAETRTGNILLDLTRGFLRVVGGQISKRNPTRIQTATATIGVRGGITMVETSPQGTSAGFLFGQEMTFQGNDGPPNVIDRPGFGASINPAGNVTLGKLEIGALNQLLSNFGAPGPNSNPPPSNPGSGTPPGVGTLVRREDSFPSSPQGSPGPSNNPQTTLAQLPPPPVPSPPPAVYTEPPARVGSPT